MSVNINNIEPLLSEMKNQKISNTGEGFDLNSLPSDDVISSQDAMEQQNFLDTHHGLLHVRISQEVDGRSFSQHLLNDNGNLSYINISPQNKTSDVGDISQYESLIELSKNGSDIFPLLSSEFAELSFEIKVVDTNMSSFLDFSLSILSLNLTNDSSIKIFELASVIPGNSNMLSTIVPVRLIPLGALGNGYLSNLPSIDIHTIRDQIAFGRKALTAQSQLSKHDTLFNMQSSITSYKGDSSNVVTTMSATLAQKTVSQEVLKELSNSAPVLSEIAKRYLLITASEEGAVLWYRDYEIDEVSRENMFQRLNDNDFVKENNIKKIFVNGELFWVKNGEEK